MDKRQQGRHYRRDALFALARLGYATTRQLARFLHGSCTESAVKMTGRTLRWLRDAGFVVAKRDGGSVTGELLVAVNAKGRHGCPNWVSRFLVKRLTHGTGCAMRTVTERYATACSLR